MARALIVCLLPGALIGVYAAHGAKHERLVSVEAKRFEFVPSTITINNHQTTRLRLTSKDVEHGLRLPDLGVDVVIPAGGTADVLLSPREAGAFTARCDVYCGAHHKTMSLTVEVRP